MADEVVIKSGRVFVTGSEKWEIRDADKTAVFVDLLTEARCINGVVYLGFASSVIDANTDGVAQTEARIRMSLVGAQFLHQMLGGMINDALKPVDKSQQN